jgi:predicted CopG family antitoxin
MAAPVKPKHKLKSHRGYFYLDADLYARLLAESERRGGASVSDIVRRYVNQCLPKVAVSAAMDDSLKDRDSS